MGPEDRHFYGLHYRHRYPSNCWLQDHRMWCQQASAITTRVAVVSVFDMHPGSIELAIHIACHVIAIHALTRRIDTPFHSLAN